MLQMAAKRDREYVRTARERERRDHLSATPERMAKTGAEFEVIATMDERGRTWEPQLLQDAPLDRLHKAGALCRGQDKETGEERFAAGQRLYAHWYHGRTFALGSRDYRKPHIGLSGDPYSIAPTQERVEHQRQLWRKAEAALGGDRIAIVTRAIVIEEKDPTKVGQIISGRQHEAQARAVAIEFLIDGLDRLRAHFDAK